MTKLFFDTEFTGLHQNTNLISIGIVSESSKVFYAEIEDYDKSQLNDWLQNHVIDNLFLNKNNQMQNKNIFFVKTTQSKLKRYLSVWLKSFNSKIEIWSDCLSYDWVLFNNIFGTAFDIPKEVFYIPFDICTYFKIEGIDPDINREQFVKGKINSIKQIFSKMDISVTKHNSLWDAFVIKACYNKLQDKTHR